MKKTFKRMTALIVAAMLTLTLVSCGGGDESSNAPASNNGTTNTSKSSENNTSKDAAASEDASVVASEDVSADVSADASEEVSTEEPSEDVSIDIDQFEFDPEELTVWKGKVFHNASLLGGGAFEVNAMGELATTGEHNIGVVLNDTFTTGKISATLIAAGGAEGDNDNGIIFGLSEGEENYFWETEGRSYYFLFVSDACDLYLAKVGVNPAEPWQALSVASLADNGFTYVHGMEITISAEVKADGTIICSADGKELITYKDESPLKGSGYGVRGEWTQVSWSDLTVEKN